MLSWYKIFFIFRSKYKQPRVSLNFKTILQRFSYFWRMCIQQLEYKDGLRIKCGMRVSKSKGTYYWFQMVEYSLTIKKMWSKFDIKKFRELLQIPIYRTECYLFARLRIVERDCRRAVVILRDPTCEEKHGGVKMVSLKPSSNQTCGRYIRISRLKSV